MRDEIDLSGYRIERSGLYWHVYHGACLIAVSFWRDAAAAAARRHWRRERLNALMGCS